MKKILYGSATTAVATIILMLGAILLISWIYPDTYQVEACSAGSVDECGRGRGNFVGPINEKEQIGKIVCGTHRWISTDKFYAKSSGGHGEGEWTITCEKTFRETSGEWLKGGLKRLIEHLTSTSK